MNKRATGKGEGWQARLFRKVLGAVPAGVRERMWQEHASDNMEMCLSRLRDKGFSPRQIVDCGAYMGHWTRMAKRVFPSARVLMIEPQRSKKEILEGVVREFSGTVDYAGCLLGPEKKDAVTFYDMESGSSVLEELSNYPRKAITLPMTRLDDVLKELKIEGPAFLKLDVQGYEIEVLKGAREAMKTSEVIQLEVSIIPYNKSVPLFDEVVRFMKEHGFLVYDICDFKRWEEDTLFQADAIFLRSDSGMRKLEFVY
jgi:FkbM family methyltransferase